MSNTKWHPNWPEQSDTEGEVSVIANDGTHFMVKDLSVFTENPKLKSLRQTKHGRAVIDLSSDPLATPVSVDFLLKLDSDSRSLGFDEWGKLSEPAMRAKLACMLAFVQAHDYPKREVGFGRPHLLSRLRGSIRLLATTRTVSPGWVFAFAAAMDEPELAEEVLWESIAPHNEGQGVQPDPLTPDRIPAAAIPAMRPKYMVALARAAEERYAKTDVLLRVLEVYDDLEAKGGAFAIADFVLQRKSVMFGRDPDDPVTE